MMLSAEDKVYELWKINFHNLKCYYVTSNKFEQEILRDGLDPNKKPEIFSIAKKLYELTEPLLAVIHAETLYEKKSVFVSIGLCNFSWLNAPEIIKLLASLSQDFINEQKDFIIPSNGNYQFYFNLCKQSNNHKILDDTHFHKIHSNFNKIIELTEILSKFVKESKATVFEIDIEGIFEDLPQEVIKAITDFSYFKNIFFPISGANITNVILNYHDFEIKHKIDKKYIHIKK